MKLLESPHTFQIKTISTEINYIIFLILSNTSILNIKNKIQFRDDPNLTPRLAISNESNRHCSIKC